MRKLQQSCHSGEHRSGRRISRRHIKCGQGNISGAERGWTHGKWPRRRQIYFGTNNVRL
ncbi:hypothetical protein KSP39_PZI004231 [Platanthera zijinensis]|uniref:Uncharacterized protein n=1 Tax=Platanthera zijinensis TaxID=2320716 RepID=A0AAP0BWH7_9ASPA